MGNPIVKDIRRVILGNEVLSDTTLNLEDGMLTFELFSNVNSKYSSAYSIGVLNKESKDGDGLTALVSLSDKTIILFTSPDLEFDDGQNNLITISNKDVLMFPNHVEFTVLSGTINIKNFATADQVKIGEGDNVFRVGITFSDDYYIDVYANSEEEAKLTAYDTGFSYWTHRWPEDEELEKFTTTRRTRWGKKMLRIEKND